MTDDDLRALLGDAYAETTDEQREAIAACAVVVDARYPEPDLADDRRDALTAAMMLVLGDDTLEDVASRWRAAGRVYEQAQLALTGAIIATAGPGVPGAVSESECARRAEVTRVTVRKAIGK